MKRVGVREVHDTATKYLAGNELLAIERHGQQIGVYIPTAGERSGKQLRAAEALERLGRTVERILAETGITEDELVDLFDLSKPLPDELAAGEREPEVAGHAVGH
jgi:hypothetical protein